MRWLIDSDILIEGERGNPAFVHWLESVEEVATAEVVRCEFLLGSGTGILPVCFKTADFRNSQARCLRHYRASHPQR